MINKTLNLMQVALLVLLGGAFSLGALGTSYGDWKSGKIRGGGYVQNVVLAPSDSNRLYAYVDVGGLFKSEDQGQSWRLITSGLPAMEAIYSCRSIDVDPKNADTLLYAAGSHTGEPIGLFRSIDGGAQWTRVLNAQYFGNEAYRWSGVVIARSPTRIDTILTVTAGDGAWRSEDNGLTWKKIGLEGVYATDVKFDPTTPGRVWVAAMSYVTTQKPALYGGIRPSPDLSGGLWRSDDYGTSWQLVAKKGPEEVVAAKGLLLGLFNEGTEIKISEDHGASWKNFGQGLPQLNNKNDLPGVHAINSLPSGWVAVTAMGEVYVRNDGGQHWELVRHHSATKGDWWGSVPGDSGWVNFGKSAGSIVVDPRNPKRWWMTDWYAIWETTNEGKDWALRIDGFETTVIHSLLQDPANPKTVHLGMADNGYYFSRDGAESFIFPKNTFNNAKSLTLSLADPKKIYGSGTTTGEWVANTLFESSDSGRNWKKISPVNLPSDKDQTYNTIVASPTVPKRLYAAVSGARGGVYQSNDGGHIWRKLNEGFVNAETFFAQGIWDTGRQLAVDAKGNMVAISLKHRMQKYDVASNKWMEIAVPPVGRLEDIKADENRVGVFYVAGDNGVFKSVNSGASWINTLPVPSRRLTVDVLNSKRIAAGTRDGVFYSVDGGENWSLISQQLPHKTYGVVTFAGDRIVVGSWGNGVFWKKL